LKRERVQRRSDQYSRWAFVVGLLFIEGASPKGMASVVAGLYRRRTTNELL
jgi:hypothetical protein